jgi:hypothetical protein
MCELTHSCRTCAYPSHIHLLRTRAALPIRTLLARSPCAEEQLPRRPPRCIGSGRRERKSTPLPPIALWHAICGTQRPCQKVHGGWKVSMGVLAASSTAAYRHASSVALSHLA